MRYYLDTNILVYLLNRNSDELSNFESLIDYSNTYFTDLHRN